MTTPMEEMAALVAKARAIDRASELRRDPAIHELHSTLARLLILRAKLRHTLDDTDQTIATARDLLTRLGDPQ